jgi:dephospho-CoA kinase
VAAALPFRLGLTGGIGSGKSTVAALLAQQGAGVVDADAISRATTAAGGSAIAPIRQQFGAGFITPDGALDRERMRAQVFDDPQAKARLEAIIHPLVGLEVAAQSRALAAAGVPCIVFDVPLLVESGHWRTRVQRVLVVDCSADTQVQRVTQRSGMAPEQVQKIIAAQASRLNRLAAADLVLCNEHISLEDLATLVMQIGRQFGL